MLIDDDYVGPWQMEINECILKMTTEISHFDAVVPNFSSTLKRRVIELWAEKTKPHLVRSMDADDIEDLCEAVNGVIYTTASDLAATSDDPQVAAAAIQIGFGAIALLQSYGDSTVYNLVIRIDYVGDSIIDRVLSGDVTYVKHTSFQLITLQ